MNDLHLIYRKERERITISGTRRGKDERGRGYITPRTILWLWVLLFLFLVICLVTFYIYTHGAE